jgi:hypothetical protein
LPSVDDDTKRAPDLLAQAMTACTNKETYGEYDIDYFGLGLTYSF